MRKIPSASAALSMLFSKYLILSHACTAFAEVLRLNSGTKSRQKSLRVFLFAIQSHLYSFALRFHFFKVTQPLKFLQCVTVHCEEIHTETSSLRTLKIITRASKKLYVYEFGFRLFYLIHARPFLLPNFIKPAESGVKAVR